MIQSTLPDEIVNELRAGNLRFIGGQSRYSPNSSLRKLKEFAVKGQLPKAIILACSDSRAPVEMVFDQDIGDLFVIRVAGNIVAPSLVGSVEFAAETYGVRLVLVMGHSYCGAVTVALEHIDDPLLVSSDNIYDIVSRIKPHIEQIAKMPNMSHEQKLALAVEANVYSSMQDLSTSSPILKDLVARGKLSISGAVMHLDTGVVTFLDSPPSPV